MELAELKKIMDYEVISKSKYDLLHAIAIDPHKYTSCLHTTVQSQLLQKAIFLSEKNLMKGIRKVIENYFIQFGYDLHNQVLTKRLNDNITFFQFTAIYEEDDLSLRLDEFEYKICKLVQQYDENLVSGSFYTLTQLTDYDERLIRKAIQEIASDYNVNVTFLQEGELFSFLNIPDEWDNFINNLVNWKEGINDKERYILGKGDVSQLSFTTIRKLFLDEKVNKDILPIIISEEAITDLIQRLRQGATNAEKKLLSLLLS